MPPPTQLERRLVPLGDEALEELAVRDAGAGGAEDFVQVAQEVGERSVYHQ
jgi:hypothetical protein